MSRGCVCMATKAVGAWFVSGDTRAPLLTAATPSCSSPPPARPRITGVGVAASRQLSGGHATTRDGAWPDTAATARDWGAGGGVGGVTDASGRLAGAAGAGSGMGMGLDGGGSRFRGPGGVDGGRVGAMDGARGGRGTASMLGAAGTDAAAAPRVSVGPASWWVSFLRWPLAPPPTPSSSSSSPTGIAEGDGRAPGVTSLAWSPCGQYLAAACAHDSGVVVWDMAVGRATPLPQREVRSCSDMPTTLKCSLPSHQGFVCGVTLCPY